MGRKRRKRLFSSFVSWLFPFATQQQPHAQQQHGTFTTLRRDSFLAVDGGLDRLAGYLYLISSMPITVLFEIR